MSGYRKERLEKQIRMIIAETLLRDIKDPRIGFVTVTGVKLNKDKTRYSHSRYAVKIMKENQLSNSILSFYYVKTFQKMVFQFLFPEEYNIV